MGHRPTVDKQSCQSSGRCVRSEPEVFAFDADHLSEVRAGAPELPLARLLGVARNCPALAIAILDDAGREVGL